MNNYRQITWRYLKQNKKRTILTILGIVLAISLFSAIGTFLYSFQDNMIEREKFIGGNYEVSYLGLDKKQINYIKNNFNISSFGIENPEKTFDCVNENKNSKLNLTYYDYNNFKDIKKFNIVEGNTPKNSNEILIEKKAIINLNKKLGDEVKVSIDNREKTYKISGFYKPKLQYFAQKYEAYGVLDNNNLKDEKIYNVFVRFKDKKNIRGLGKELGNNLGLKKEEVKFNESLLELMMQGRSHKNNLILLNMIGIVVGIIVISTVAVIYNAFNISVAERIKQFGILRSIGASPSKIKKIVLKEGLIMCLISIPLGIILGYIGIYVVVKILMYYYKAYALKLIGFNIFDINFYPQVILISTVLGFITVFLSVISPAINASKISPMDAIRNSGKFKKEKIKRRKARLTKLLFGIEGQVAYKNIKRNNKSFIITIISLSVSFVMFVGFTSFMIVQKERMRYYNEELSCDSSFHSLDEKIDENIIKKLKENKYVKDIYIRNRIYYPMYIDLNFINNNFLNVDEVKKGINGLKVGEKDYFETQNGSVEAWNEISLKSLDKDLVDGKIDLKALREGGVILADTNVKKENDKKVVDRITKYKVGDIIKIPVTSESFKENKIDLDGFYKNGEKNIREKAKKAIEENSYFEVKVIGIVKQCNIITDVGRTKLDLIFDKTAFENKFFKIPTRRFEIKLNDNSEHANNYFENFAECNSLMYVNYAEVEKQNKSMDIIMNTFIYGFISIVSLISIINIINTITMGLLLRKKEFATLNAIGMTKRQLSKMVLLEGILYGVIVSIVGSIASYGVFKLLLNNSNEIMEMPYSTLKIVGVFIAGIIAINLLTFIASLVPLRKFKNMNIIENIKEEE